MTNSLTTLGVFEKEGKLIVGSRNVANVFEKRHDNVLQGCDILSCSTEFRLLNFQESSYVNEQGRNMREVLMTRDGLTLLVMGYVGKKAMQFKEAYIAEFNRMEFERSKRTPITRMEIIAAAMDELTKWNNEIQASNIILSERIVEQETQIAELTPKATYCDLVLAGSNSITTTIIAKDYGWTAFKLNKFLHEQHVIYKCGETWVLYDELASLGYMCSETHALALPDGRNISPINWKWTQKGRLFIYELMTSHGHKPLMELAEEERMALNA